ncbi:MAG: Rrf2 family transcriptional regulator [Deltaproteobacteria bacterium]|nr:Rrf2 family transcriptional regulator [Deltaproteobacteria bacterium]
MRLTRAGEYGVRCILFLAGNGHGKVVGRVEIAKAMDIPEQFLGKIAQQLAKSGFIEIIQGAKGGYRLLLSPDKLTLLDVVEAVTGEIFLNDCIMRPESCFRSPGCSIHRVWEKAREQLRNTLREATFAKLIEGETCIFPLISSELSEENKIKEDFL